jgi:FHS family L-fucose permease-like MFS transporter
MIAYFTIASGMTILQTAINPYVAAIGSEKSSSSRLTLAQAFNSLGTTIAPAIGAFFVLSDKIKTKDEIATLAGELKVQYLSDEAWAVQKPFLWISLLLLIISLGTLFTKLPNILEQKGKGTYLQALKHKNLWMGVLGIFCYVGAEVTIGSYLVNYFLSLNIDELILSHSGLNWIATQFLSSDLSQLDSKAIVGVFVTFYWTGAMIGRFVGAYLSRLMSPAKLISIFASLAILMILTSVNSIGITAMISILSVGLFNSIMFPTIFTISLIGLDDLKPKASGLLCMAIVGGAILPPVYGFFVDLSGFQSAFIVLLICYAYIGFFGWSNRKIIASEE